MRAITGRATKETGRFILKKEMTMLLLGHSSKLYTFVKTTQIMTDVWYMIADCSYWVFGIMAKMGMGPNLLFMAIGGFLFVYWMYLQSNYNKKATETGGYE